MFRNNVLQYLKAIPTSRTHQNQKSVAHIEKDERFHPNEELMMCCRTSLCKESSLAVVVIRPLPAPSVILFISGVRLLQFSMFNHGVIEVQQGAQTKPYAIILLLVLLRNLLFCMACVFLTSQYFEEFLSVSTFTSLSFFFPTAQLSIMGWTLTAGLHSQPWARTWSQRLEKPAWDENEARFKISAIVCWTWR